jgi:hypothetical protein
MVMPEMVELLERAGSMIGSHQSPSGTASC